MDDLRNFAFEALLHGDWCYLERENYKYPIPFLLLIYFSRVE
jgi:hypothetical protein